jgi:hypothetical protein
MLTGYRQTCKDWYARGSIDIKEAPTTPCEVAFISSRDCHMKRLQPFCIIYNRYTVTLLVGIYMKCLLAMYHDHAL